MHDAEPASATGPAYGDPAAAPDGPATPPGTGGGGHVVVVGEPLVAFVAEDGPLPTARHYRAHVTGAEANLAIALARLGHRVEYVGRVGEDGLGTLVTRTLRGEGVGVGALRVTPGRATGVIVREAALHGPAEVVHHRATTAGATLGANDLARAAGLFPGAAWLALSGITPALSGGAADAVRAAVQLAARHGVRVALDVNMRRGLWTPARARAALTPLLAHCTLVLADDAELAVLADGGPGPAVAALFGHGVRAVVRKLGAAGAEVHLPGARPLHLAAAPGVPVRDTVGAGDAFAAGYLSALLDGADWADPACGRGHQLGGYAVTALGDTTALPERWRLTRHDTQR
jgi:2-dehydro-3-deoxygluconokinase